MTLQEYQPTPCSREHLTPPFEVHHYQPQQQPRAVIKTPTNATSAPAKKPGSHFRRCKSERMDVSCRFLRLTPFPPTWCRLQIDAQESMPESSQQRQPSSPLASYTPGGV
ncbi:hypothetical protein ZHAS_00015451 [Anopheles sinensis]|uniref:Uncharacterized protein n=1 Tax=Anopheles sinensis TaxID=74873 RepID=A0A084WBA3_ANOSI|nr:hypothetical protein ZHAS_00015451 [Anopheles sinensis]